jgi:hypothetical protein
MTQIVITVLLLEPDCNNRIVIFTLTVLINRIVIFPLTVLNNRIVLINLTILMNRILSKMVIRECSRPL